MWIFISRLPRETKRKDVLHFVNQALKPGWLLLPLTTRAHISRCELMQIVDRDTGDRELHGLAEIEPCRMVPGVIERLNSTLFQDTPLLAHQYCHRSPNKDRRIKNDKTAKEKRNQDRRRLHLSIEILQRPRSRSAPGHQRIHY